MILRLPLALCYAALVLVLGCMAMVAIVVRVFLATLRGSGAEFSGVLAETLRRGK